MKISGVRLNVPTALCLDIRQLNHTVSRISLRVDPHDLPVAYAIFYLCHLEITTIRARKQAA